RLVARAQLRGHAAKRPSAILRLLRPRERALMLLNGAVLGGCLCLGLHQQVLRGLLRQILRRERLRLAVAFTDLDLRRDVLRDLGAEAERLVLREEAVPFLRELREIWEVVSLPMLDRIVILLRQRPDVVFHTSSVPSRRMARPHVRLSERRARLARAAGRSGGTGTPGAPSAIVQIGFWISSEEHGPLA